MTDLLFAAVARALDLVVIERLPDRSLTLVCPPPPWFAEMAIDGARLRLRETLPYVDEFMGEAEAFWWQEEEGAVSSGPFAADLAGEELLLRARAVTAAGRKLLVLERLTGPVDTRPVVQTAREARLEHERLVKRVEGLRPQAATLTRLARQLLDTDLTAAQRELVEHIQQAAAKVQAAGGS